jgi:hypothetical protein
MKGYAGLYGACRTNTNQDRENGEKRDALNSNHETVHPFSPSNYLEEGSVAHHSNISRTAERTQGQRTASVHNGEQAAFLEAQHFWTLGRATL